MRARALYVSVMKSRMIKIVLFFGFLATHVMIVALMYRMDKKLAHVLSESTLGTSRQEDPDVENVQAEVERIAKQVDSLPDSDLRFNLLAAISMEDGGKSALLREFIFPMLEIEMNSERSVVKEEKMRKKKRKRHGWNML